MASAFKNSDYCIADALGALSTIEDLRDELQNWYDNLPENFQNGDKGSALQEAIDQLDAANNVSSDLPDSCTFLDSERVQVSEYKRATSRSKRCSDACSALHAAHDFLSEYATTARERSDDETTPEERPPVPEGEDDPNEGRPVTRDEWANVADELENYCSELSDAIDSFESAEFPGMYG